MLVHLSTAIVFLIALFVHLDDASGRLSTATDFGALMRAIAEYVVLTDPNSERTN